MRLIAVLKVGTRHVVLSYFRGAEMNCSVPLPPFTTLSLMTGVRLLQGGRGALGSFPQATPDAKSIFKQSCRPALEWNWHRDLICAAL